MGQIVVGVLLGCSLPEAVIEVFFDDDGETLVDSWRDSKSWAIQRQIEWVEDSTVVGVWVACAEGRDKGVQEIDGPLSFEELAKGEAYARALGVWQEFSQWVQKTRDIKLPAPQLFVSPTEVA
jgi:hypothetical protein